MILTERNVNEETSFLDIHLDPSLGLSSPLIGILSAFGYPKWCVLLGTVAWIGVDSVAECDDFSTKFLWKILPFCLAVALMVSSLVYNLTGLNWVAWKYHLWLPAFRIYVSDAVLVEFYHRAWRLVVFDSGCIYNSLFALLALQQDLGTALVLPSHLWEKLLSARFRSFWKEYLTASCLASSRWVAWAFSSTLSEGGTGFLLSK